MPIGRKQGRSYGYVLTLRSKDKIMGTSNNFVCQLPSAFAVTSENYLIKLINAHIPLPQYSTNTNATHLFRTGGVEILADFGAKTYALDSSRGGMQSHGFTKMPEGVITSQSTALVNDGEKPTHIVSNPNFQNIRCQLKDSDGNLLLSYAVSDGATALLPNCVSQFLFEPIA